MIVPSFTALLSDPSGQIGSNQGPFLGAVFLYQFHNLAIFIFGPWTFDQGWFQDLLPAMQALDFGALGQALRNEFPVLGPVFFDRSAESFVFLFRPFDTCLLSTRIWVIRSTASSAATTRCGSIMMTVLIVASTVDGC